MAESIISNVLNKAIDGAFNYEQVLSWGTYNTEGQTATLTRDVTKAKMIRLWCGWDSADNKSGIHFDYYDNVTIGTTRSAFYAQGSTIFCVTFRFPTATTIEIVSCSGGLGIREIKGVF